MIDSASSAYLYGKGIFTTIAIVDGAPLLWEKHWRRLTANAAKLDIDISEYAESEILDALTSEIENRALTDGRARVTFHDESESAIWGAHNETTISVCLITGGHLEITMEV